MGVRSCESRCLFSGRWVVIADTTFYFENDSIWIRLQGWRCVVLTWNRFPDEKYLPTDSSTSPLRSLLDYRYVQVWIIAKRRKQSPVGWFIPKLVANLELLSANALKFLFIDNLTVKVLHSTLIRLRVLPDEFALCGGEADEKLSLKRCIFILSEPMCRTTLFWECCLPL